MGQSRLYSSYATSIFWILSVFITCAVCSCKNSCPFSKYPGSANGRKVAIESYDRSAIEILNETRIDWDRKTVAIVFDNSIEDGELEKLLCFSKVIRSFLIKRDYQLILSKSSNEAIFDSSSSQHRAMPDTGPSGNSLQIYVYQDGYRRQYFGALDPNVFISWISKTQDSVTFLNSEFQMKKFLDADSSSRTRVVGYFRPGSKRLSEFRATAAHLDGDADFYVVVDSTTALRLGIQSENEIYIYRPFEDNCSFHYRKNNQSATFERLRSQTKPVLQELTPVNYHRIFTRDAQLPNIILAIYNGRNSQGKAFFDALKSFVRLNGQKYVGKLAIWAIDRRRFPIIDWKSLGVLESDIEETGILLGLADRNAASFYPLDVSNLTLSAPINHSHAISHLDLIFTTLLSSSPTLSDPGHPLDLTNTTSDDRLLHFDKRYTPKKTKKMKFKKPPKRRGPKDKDPKSHLLIEQIDYSDHRPDLDFCDREIELLQNRVEILEERVIFLEELVEHLSKDQGSTETPRAILGKRPKSQLLTKGARKIQKHGKSRSIDFSDRSAVVNSSMDKINQSISGDLNRSIDKINENRSIDISFSYTSFNLLPQPPSGFLKMGRRGSYKKSPRRCTRKNLKNCNVLEYHTTINPIAMYFVCAFLISMLRAMRITVSFYICPVIDDWRDFLRRKVPRRLQHWLRERNVRF